MRALVYTAPNEIEMQHYPEPHLVDGDVILKIDAVGICGSDMHAYHGHDPRRKPGLVLGHEFSGTIVQSAAKNHKIGERVTGNPLITCGTCDYCVQGRSNLCSNRTMVGMTRPGAFAEFMSIPASSLIAMPQDMPAAKAALTEPTATALHAILMSMKMMARPIPESRTLVIGGGAIGMLSALLLRHFGCNDLVLAEVNPLRRQLAEKHAGAQTYDPRETMVQENGFEYVIDAVGSKITRTAALQAIRPGGVVMHIGLQDWASEIDMRKLTLAEIALLGTYTYSTADLRATVKLLYNGSLGDLSWVLTRPLADGGKIFAELDSGKIANAKVVLVP
ncbi:MAG: galactitol-1-phosphate 5-dehydrogenase [Alphaproteobacteria bacterium]|nr:galactitol-1-phosphate 5-dehydrogenase [Alphaproteobacteria bacterium]